MILVDYSTYMYCKQSCTACIIKRQHTLDLDEAESGEDGFELSHFHLVEAFDVVASGLEELEAAVAQVGATCAKCVELLLGGRESVPVDVGRLAEEAADRTAEAGGALTGRRLADSGELLTDGLKRGRRLVRAQLLHFSLLRLEVRLGLLGLEFEQLELCAEREERVAEAEQLAEILVR